MKVVKERLKTILGYTLSGGVILPIFICSFVTHVPSQLTFEAVWASVMADIWLMMVMAVIGGVIGFGLGTYQTVTGK